MPEVKKTKAPAVAAADAIGAIETALLQGSLDAELALRRAFPPSKPVPVYQKTAKRYASFRRKIRLFNDALHALDTLQPASMPAVAPTPVELPLRVNGNGAAVHA